jgi:uncharacterized protein
MSRIKHLLAAAAISLPLLTLAQAAAVPPIVSAASLGKTATVTALIAKGADPDVRQADGRTALMLAADAGHFETVRALMIGGASRDLQDPTGRTAFDYAFEKKHTDIIALLRDAS